MLFVYNNLNKFPVTTNYIFTYLVENYTFYFLFYIIMKRAMDGRTEDGDIGGFKCVCVCARPCLRASDPVCEDAMTDSRSDGWIDGWMDGWMDRWIAKWMDSYPRVYGYLSE